MSAFEKLNTHWSSHDLDLVKLIAATPVASVREQAPEELDHLYKDGDVSDEAKLAAEDDGYVEGSEGFIEAVKHLQEKIDKKNGQRQTATKTLQKGKRGDLFWNDPFAVATAMLIRMGKAIGGDSREEGTSPPWHKGEFKRGGELAALRDKLAAAIAKKMGWHFGGGATPVTAMQLAQNVDLEKVSPNLERLLAFGAGWALSGDIVNRDIPSDLVREWERAVNRQASDSERRSIERKIKSRLRKSEDIIDAFDDLTDFWLQKDHAPIPPRIGLMWDAVKHRWTRPERIGRTVWELSGHKRIRGTGTGVHERSVRAGGVGGKGAGSAVSGRRFRSIGDSGTLHPHESKHPAFKRLQAFRKKKGVEHAKKQAKSSG